MTAKNWKPVFLDAYAETGNVKESATLAGVTKQAVYKARKNSKAFAADFTQAREEAGDVLEGEAFKRAKSTSDTLLIFLLKGLKPETYGDRIRHGGDPGNPIEHAIQPSTVELIEQMAAFKRSSAQGEVSEASANGSH